MQLNTESIFEMALDIVYIYRTYILYRHPDEICITLTIKAPQTGCLTS